MRKEEKRREEKGVVNGPVQCVRFARRIARETYAVGKGREMKVGMHQVNGLI